QAGRCRRPAVGAAAGRLGSAAGPRRWTPAPDGAADLLPRGGRSPQRPAAHRGRATRRSGGRGAAVLLVQQLVGQLAPGLGHLPPHLPLLAPGPTFRRAGVWPPCHHPPPRPRGGTALGHRPEDRTMGDPPAAPPEGSPGPGDGPPPDAGPPVD